MLLVSDILRKEDFMADRSFVPHDFEPPFAWPVLLATGLAAWLCVGSTVFTLLAV